MNSTVRLRGCKIERLGRNHPIKPEPVLDSGEQLELLHDGFEEVAHLSHTATLLERQLRMLDVGPRLQSNEVDVDFRAERGTKSASP